MKQSLVYPNFQSWKDHAIRTKSGLQVAPEDFVIIDEYDNFQKEYFSFDEAMKIERRILRPNGWRLPTDKEWEELMLEHGENSFSLTSELSLRFLGYLTEKSMKDFRLMGSDRSLTTMYSQAKSGGQNGCGFYWTSTSSSRFSAFVFINSGDTLQTVPLNKYKGLSIRCVRGTHMRTMSIEEQQMMHA